MEHFFTVTDCEWWSIESLITFPYVFLMNPFLIHHRNLPTKDQVSWFRVYMWISRTDPLLCVESHQNYPKSGWNLKYSEGRKWRKSLELIAHSFVIWVSWQVFPMTWKWRFWIVEAKVMRGWENSRTGNLMSNVIRAELRIWSHFQHLLVWLE